MMGAIRASRDPNRRSLTWLIAALALCLATACGPGDKGGEGTPGDCLAGETSCDDACVDTNADPAHCGACGNACASDEVCDGAGVCSRDCPSGLVNCGGACVDTAIDPGHCGGCDNACMGTDACVSGTCEDDSCTEATSEARSAVLPADIIVVVDNSGSMTDEAEDVQESMNDFVTAITSSDIDAHVILISADSNNDEGICVPPPLGSGACPNDENLPAFRHVNMTVGSSNSLQMILDTYPQWRDSLRPDATRTIAVISDDNSGLAAAAFTSQMVALDPTFTGFKFDAIVAPYDLNGAVCALCAFNGNPCTSCDPCCGPDSAIGALCVALPADQGTVYQDLVSQTGGVEGNLCTQEFLPAFQDMATAVISDSQVSCLYDIPDPDNGMAIDYGRVNVEYQPNAQSMGQVIPNVPGGEGDCGPSGGWYYNNAMPPTQVLLCPDTCMEVQANLEARIAVKFGCTTVVD